VRTVDWNWFFSSLAQSVAALVGIFAAFIITKVVNNQAEFNRKKIRLKELLSVSAKYRDALLDRSFDWYSKHKLKHTLDSLDFRLDDETNRRAPEGYYENFNFPPYLPRSEVLNKIEEKIRRHSGRSSQTSYPGMMDVESVRFNAAQDMRFRETVNEEGERISSLILDVRQHIRLVKLHLSELEGNPEASKLISSSIIGAILLFFLGIIYPLSFLPVDTEKPISFSIAAFFPVLFSLKGFMLAIVGLIFSAIMITFWFVNLSLKYKVADMQDLRRAEGFENYSEHLRVMTENQEAQRKWAELARSPANDT
jgi:hypothetical protein